MTIRRSFLALGILLFVALSSFSQTPANERFRSLVKKTTFSNQDTLLVLQLCDFAFSFNEANDSVIAYARKALRLSQRLSYKKGLGRANWLMGMANYYKGEIDSADYYLGVALTNSEAVGDLREQGRIYNSMANSARFKGNAALAIDLYFKSLAIQDKNGDLLGKAFTLNNIGNVYVDQQEIRKALVYLKRSLNIRKQIGNENTSSMLHANIAECYLSLKQLDSTKYFVIQGLRYARTGKDYWGLTNVYEVGVRYYKSIKEPDSAFLYIQEGLRCAALSESDDKAILFKIELAQYYMDNGQFKAALNEVETILGNTGKSRRLAYEADAIRIKRDAMAQLGFFKEAFNLSLRHKILFDSLQKLSYKENLLTQGFAYDLEKAKINSEKEKIELAKKLLRNRWITIASVITTFGIGVLAFAFYRNIQFRKEASAKLNIKQGEIENKNKELILQKEKILSMNEKLEEAVVHRTKELDESVKTLTQQNHNLEQFSYIVSHNLRAPIARIQGLLNVLKLKDYSPDELNNLYQLLFNSSTQLDEVIRNLTDILNIRTGEQSNSEEINLNELLTTLRDTLDLDLKEARALVKSTIPDLFLFRGIKAYFHSIFFNLISNAIKYRIEGLPLIISLHAEVRQNRWHFMVKDNGLGIDLSSGNHKKIFGLYQRFHPNFEGKGFGLYLVKTQLEAMNGEIQVRSEPGKGTEFIFSIPRIT